MFKRYWNGTLLGVPAGFIQLIFTFCNKIIDLINSKVKKLNLGSKSNRILIQKNVFFAYPQNIYLGEDVVISKNTVFESEYNNTTCQIGDNTFIGRSSHIDFSGDLIIGSNCTISENVLIETHDHGLNPRSKPQKTPLIIEDNVWIGARAIILQGIEKIEKNSIIAAGAVVTKTVPSNCIVAGIPAKLLKKFL